MAEHVRVLIPEDEIRDKIIEVADKISEAYKGESLHLICILKGGAMFMCELAKRIHDVNISFDFMSVSSYGAGTTTSGIVKIVKDLDEPLEGKNVLIVEDIIDSGITAEKLRQDLAKHNPKSVKMVSLLFKPEALKVGNAPEYVGFEIPRKFILGYGLDIDGLARNLPDIYVLKVNE